jgi:acyl-CoA oxidase
MKNLFRIPKGTPTICLNKEKSFLYSIKNFLKIPKKMSEIFAQARANSKIDPQELIALFYPGQDQYKNFVDFSQKIADNGLADPPNITEYSRVEQLDYVIRNTQKFKEVMDVDFYKKAVPDVLFQDISLIAGGVGLIMVLPVVYLMGSEDQKAKWYQKVSDGDYLAAYAQTELGHGSDVQSLLTTATFNSDEDCFVVNTPSVDAYKWWPGDLGKNANHVVLYAQIISQGKRRGVFPLFFQIRDLETHQLLPGVEAGDIGPKMGYSWKDNGFLAFKNYKVPRDALLGKYISIDKAGNLTTTGDMKV